jgi:hypothetical protein
MGCDGLEFFLRLLSPPADPYECETSGAAVSEDEICPILRASQVGIPVRPPDRSRFTSAIELAGFASGGNRAGWISYSPIIDRQATIIQLGDQSTQGEIRLRAAAGPAGSAGTRDLPRL